VKLVKVVTHHLYPQKAAELFDEEETVAVGWSELGDLTGLSRDQIKRKYRKKYVGATERQA